MYSSAVLLPYIISGLVCKVLNSMSGQGVRKYRAVLSLSSDSLRSEIPWWGFLKSDRAKTGHVPDRALRRFPAHGDCADQYRFRSGLFTLIPGAGSQHSFNPAPGPGKPPVFPKPNFTLPELTIEDYQRAVSLRAQRTTVPAPAWDRLPSSFNRPSLSERFSRWFSGS